MQAVSQAHDRDLGAVRIGQLRHGGGQDTGRGRRLRLVAGGWSQHAVPPLRQVAVGRHADAVAVDAEPGTQSGELIWCDGSGRSSSSLAVCPPLQVIW